MKFLYCLGYGLGRKFLIILYLKIVVEMKFLKWYYFNMKNTKLVAYIEKDEDGIYIGSIPTIPSCYAQGKTLEKMLKNLNEVALLCLRNTEKDEYKKSSFVGIQELNLSYA